MDLVNILHQENEELKEEIQELKYQREELEAIIRRIQKKRKYYKKKYIRTKNKFYQRTYSEQNE